MMLDELITERTPLLPFLALSWDRTLN
jgi:hypothetical protein